MASLIDGRVKATFGSITRSIIVLTSGSIVMTIGCITSSVDITRSSWSTLASILRYIEKNKNRS
jgi:hypothetical protein